jgi:hypothetical protein
MLKKLILLALAILVFTGCEKEDEFVYETESDKVVATTSNFVSATNTFEFDLNITSVDPEYYVHRMQITTDKGSNDSLVFNTDGGLADYYLRDDANLTEVDFHFNCYTLAFNADSTDYSCDDQYHVNGSDHRWQMTLIKFMRHF